MQGRVYQRAPIVAESVRLSYWQRVLTSCCVLLRGREFAPGSANTRSQGPGAEKSGRPTGAARSIPATWVGTVFRRRY